MPGQLDRWWGVVVRRHRRAQPTRHPGLAGGDRALGGRDRARARSAAAVGLEAPARAARGRVRAVAGGSAETTLPTETGASHGARRVAGPLPPFLVEARRCAGAVPREDGRCPPCERKETMSGRESYQ